ncbi:MAG: pyridoxamine 5'-phosphate oxidase family protein [Pseudomonadota bacterium]
MTAPRAITELDGFLDAAWGALDAGAGSGKSAFSMVQIATVGTDGGPRARTVVIRANERAKREVAFHTDIRSPKVRELHRDPRLALIGYDMDAGLQVRAEGRARLHKGDDVALSAWSAAKLHSRICYRSEFSPGEAIASGEFGDPTDSARAPENEDVGYENFCRVVATIERIEWLDLAHSGHRRAQFVWRDESWIGGWIAP